MKKNTTTPLIIGYVLKVPYPAQKIGDFIEIVKAPPSIVTYRFSVSKIAVDEKLIKDGNFFRPILFDKNVNDTVLIQRYNHAVRAGVITAIAGENVSIRFINGKPKTAIVKYDKVFDVVNYWHFNSMLQPCLVPVTSQRGFDEMNQRVKLGNYFETKEECRAVINKITTILKNKNERN